MGAMAFRRRASPPWWDLTLFPKFKDTELLSFVFMEAMSFSGLLPLWLTHCVDTVILFKNIQFTCPPNRDPMHDYGVFLPQRFLHEALGPGMS